MKKISTQIFTFALFTIFYATAFGQDNLRYGENKLPQVISPQILFWDVLRTETPGWVRENHNTQQNIWEAFEKAVNTKDAKNRFLELSTAYWDATNMSWENNYKAQYTCVDDNNRLIEVMEEVSYDNTEYTSKQDVTYNSSGVMSSFLTSYETGSGFTQVGTTFIKYDLSGKRICDSSIFNSSSLSRNRIYEYDNQGRCTKQMVVTYTPPFSYDTTAMWTYSYFTDGKRKQNSFFSNQNSDSLREITREEFTYNQAGKIDKLMFWQRITSNGDIIPTATYSQYFTPGGKLSAMVSEGLWGTNWIKMDSTVFKYLPNGYYDTAWGHTAQNEVWSTNPTFRLVFDANPNTGITNIQKEETKLNVYPNPTKSTLFVETTPETTGKVDFVITDITGKTIKTIAAHCTANEINTIAITLDGISSGIYFLRSGGQAAKIVVE